MISKVHKFHSKFGLPLGDKNQLDKHGQIFRLKFLAEELKELEQAFEQDDLVKAFDALLDLVYVAQGTALFMGINPSQWNSGMNVVHKANMSKLRATSASESKRGTQLDVIKPDGWESPEEELLYILTQED